MEFVLKDNYTVLKKHHVEKKLRNYGVAVNNYQLIYQISCGKKVTTIILLKG